MPADDLELHSATSHSPSARTAAFPALLTATQACQALGVSARELAALRDQGFLPVTRRGARVVYPRSALELLLPLLDIANRRGWSLPTLAWFADLLFAAQVGRIVMLPLEGRGSPPSLATNGSWLSTPYAPLVLRELDGRDPTVEDSMAALLTSLLKAACGPGLFWKDREAAAASALGPVIRHLEKDTPPQEPTRPGSPILAGDSFVLLVLAFATIASPLSEDLRQIVQSTYARLQGIPEPGVPLEEQELILREQLVAVDKLYAARAAEVHSPVQGYEIRVGIMSIPRQTVSLQLKLPLEYPVSALDSVLDALRPYLGTYGSRVIQALYEIANDPPYWRSPVITVDTNTLLDRLGEKRDSRGIHYSRTRARLRDTLNAAHNLEIVGEYTTRENGSTVRKAIRRPVLSLIGATFDSQESAHLATEELFQKGLPRTMQVRLNFYEGVRRPDGTLGNQYVLLPRLAEPAALPKANYAGTHERLRHYLLLRAREGRGAPSIVLTRATALEKAGITNKNITRATQTLEKALQRLVEEGTLLSYTPIPLRPDATFTCTLRDT